MNNTVFKLIGIDEDDNSLFRCSFCGNVIPLESDGSGDIELARLSDTCPECGAYIFRIDLD